MPRAAWDEAYRRKRPDELSWYQARPALSLELIGATGVDRDARILDVGGGTSMLVDALLDRGFRRLGVLDISAVALDLARERLGRRADAVEWIHADVLDFEPDEPWTVWHDRAVLHFLVSAEDRSRYRDALYHSIVPGGHAIIATFAPHGPRSCSGFPTLRLSPEQIAHEVGEGVELVEGRSEDHTTPTGVVQPFAYARLRRS